MRVYMNVRFSSDDNQNTISSAAPTNIPPCSNQDFNNKENIPPPDVPGFPRKNNLNIIPLEFIPVRMISKF